MMAAAAAALLLLALGSARAGDACFGYEAGCARPPHAGCTAAKATEFWARFDWGLVEVHRKTMASHCGRAGGEQGALRCTAGRYNLLRHCETEYDHPRTRKEGR